MIKTEYMGYVLDEMYAVEGGYECNYINYKTKHMVSGEGKNCEGAVSAAQKKIKLRAIQ